jgi:hypothetical protein
MLNIITGLFLFLFIYGMFKIFASNSFDEDLTEIFIGDDYPNTKKP